MIKGMFKEITKLKSEITGREYEKPLLNKDIRADLDTALVKLFQEAEYRTPYYTGCDFKRINKRELLRLLRLYEEYL